MDGIMDGVLESELFEAPEFTPETINESEKEETMETQQQENLATEVNPIQKEAEEAGFNFETEKSKYEDWTNKDLKAEISRRNAAIGVQALNVSGKKEELVERLRENDVQNTSETFPRVKSQDKYVDVALGKVLQSPINPRSRLDYEDPQLRQMIEASGGLIKDPVVREAGGGDYFVIAGNRSVANLRHVVQHVWKMNPDTFIIRVKVKHYEGTEAEIQRQEMFDLEADNEGALSFGPLEKLRLVQQRLAMGNYKAAIARDMGVSSGHITQLTNLLRLPERILFLLDVQSKQEHFSRFPVDRLVEENIPFRMVESPTGDGMVREAYGISYSIAQQMTAYAPREKDFADAAAFEQAKMDFEDLVLRSDVLEVAMTQSTKQFVAFFEKAAREAGYLEAKEEKAAKPTKTEVEPSGGDEPMGLMSGEDETTDTGFFDADGKDWSAVADRIETGAIEISKKFHEKIAGKLKMNDAKAIRAVQWLLDEGILEELRG